MVYFMGIMEYEHKNMANISTSLAMLIFLKPSGE
jgi:hypothetical protein